MNQPSKTMPVMQVGKFVGVPIDQLPNSYLRWLITQSGFPKEILEAAHAKLGESTYNDTFIDISRHAIDMFSLRFLDVWQANLGTASGKKVGLSSFIAELSMQAWAHGKDVSKHRHKEDGVVKEYRGIRYVFQVNPLYPDYLLVITIMENANLST